MISDERKIERVWRIKRYKNAEDFKKGLVADKIIDGEGKTLDGETEVRGNLTLNEGIANEIALLLGTGGTNYGNANAYLGVGESTVAASASQTGLQGSSKTYKPMDTGYPSVSGNTVTWRATFDGSSANNAWQEFTLSNANSDAGDNFNRKVADQGTKVSGQEWSLELEITFS